jgi:hypothetical protein
VGDGGVSALLHVHDDVLRSNGAVLPRAWGGLPLLLLLLRMKVVRCDSRAQAHGKEQQRADTKMRRGGGVTRPRVWLFYLSHPCRVFLLDASFVFACSRSVSLEKVY